MKPKLIDHVDTERFDRRSGPSQVSITHILLSHLAMAFLYAVVLRIFHSIYALYIAFLSFWKRHHRTPPRALLAARARLPKHLAVVVVAQPNLPKKASKRAIVETVANAAHWCRQLGVPKLTIYEQHGILVECEDAIRSLVAPDSPECESSESEAEYHPLTPPPSDYSESRPLSPSHSPSLIPMTTILLRSSNKVERPSRTKAVRNRHPHGPTSVEEPTPSTDDGSRNPLQLCLISREASKPSLAAVATSLAQKAGYQTRKGPRTSRFVNYTLTIDELEAILESEDGLSPPDFMIVHSLGSESTTGKAPLELHGFPPWHIRLTEIFTSRVYPTSWFSRDSESTFPLSETILCEALDEFAGAEMRFGK